MAPQTRPLARRRTVARVAAVVLGCSALVAAAPSHAAAPTSANVDPVTNTTATWSGPSLVGNPDLLGPPSPVCNSGTPTSNGCDRFTFNLTAPSGFANRIDVSATITDTDSTTTYDVAILDSSNSVLAQETAAAGTSTITATDLLPGTYVVETDGDIGDVTDPGYTGSLKVTNAARVVQASHSDGGISGSRETVADPYRLGTEPTAAVSPDGTVYEGPIFGFSTTQSFVQRSDNSGQTFNTLGIPGVGKNTTCPGGGDEDISTDPNNNLYFLDLGGAPFVPAAVSPDHGNTFIDNCVANDTATDPNRPNHFPDRQWLSTDIKNNREWFIWRDGVVNATTPTDQVDGALYGEFIEYAPLPAGAAGAAQLVFTHLCQGTGGVGVPCFSDLTVAGNAVTDNTLGSPHYGNTYLAIGRAAGVSVAVITPSGVTEHTAAPGASNVLFPTVAVDKGGNLYETYTDSTTYQIMFTWSSDAGANWKAPIAINGAPAAVTVMPWIVAGDAGKVDIVFYGSPNTHAPTTNSGPWSVYMLQSLSANSVSPNFSDWTQAPMTDRPNHIEPVCLSGLGCTTNTGPGGDRQLGDFFRVVLDSGGRAMISFADGNNQLGQETLQAEAAPSFANFVRQATGPSLYGGNVSTIPLPTNSVTVGPHTDPIPFAAPTGPGPSNDALNLLSSSVSSDGANVHVHLEVKNLNTTTAVTAPALATSTYLTRWWFNGHVYFAAAEDNAGSLRYFSGQAAPVSDGLAIKYAYYPGSGSATGSFVTGPNGTLDITVPANQVGSPTASDTLYSVTSYTNTHALPTAPTPPTASNFTDFPQIVDVLPAYNVVPLNVGAAPEVPWTPLLVVIGVGSIAYGLRPRRLRRASH